MSQPPASASGFVSNAGHVACWARCHALSPFALASGGLPRWRPLAGLLLNEFTMLLLRVALLQNFSEAVKDDYALQSEALHKNSTSMPDQVE